MHEHVRRATGGSPASLCDAGARHAQRAIAFGSVVLGVLALPASGARADLPAAAPVAHGAIEVLEPDAPIEDGSARDLPDYDGRPDPGTDSADVALWIPRVLFAPIYAVTEYLLRQPLLLAMTELERIHAFDWLFELFTFGENRQIGIFPTVLYDFGFRPSFGVYAYWDRFLVDSNRISVHAATGGPSWWLFQARDVLRLGRFGVLQLAFEAIERPDQVFGGIGWRATQTVRSRYQVSRIDASVSAGLRPWRRSAIDLELGARTASFASGSIFGDPGVLEANPPPAGFVGGYDAVRAGASFVVDSRIRAELPVGGVRAQAFVAQNVGFGGLPSTSRWLRWGGALLLATDALGFGRVLAVHADAAFITPFDADDPRMIVPFDELIDVGGDGPLRGFWPGWIRGFSSVSLSVSYVWPIWAFLDAHLRVTVGNAFGQHLEDFALDRLRLSFDVGLDPRLFGEHPFEIFFGLGTQTFSAGTELVAFRFAVGTRLGT